MTISKKISLIIAGALAIGMNNGIHAHTSEVAYEVTQILNFSQTLRTVNNRQALNVAQWLELQACDTSHEVSDDDIRVISQVINNCTLKLESKIAILQHTMTTQKNQHIKSSIRNTMQHIGEAIFAVTLFGIFGMTAVAVAIAEANKPYCPLDGCCYNPYCNFNHHHRHFNHHHQRPKIEYHLWLRK